jgi:hypothetical protein
LAQHLNPDVEDLSQINSNRFPKIEWKKQASNWSLFTFFNIDKLSDLYYIIYKLYILSRVDERFGLTTPQQPASSARC